MIKKLFGPAFIILSLFWSTHTIAQSNLLVGYKFAYTKPEMVLDIYEQFDAENPTLQQPLPNIEYLNGLTFGYRYRFGNSAIELAWSNLGSDQKAIGVVNNTSFQKRMIWSMTQYDAGLHLFAGNISIGSGVGYRRIKTETDIPSIDVNKEILNQSEWVANVQLGLEVASKYISFAIQPYVTIPLAKTNVAPIEADLLSNPSGLEKEDDFLIFGVKLSLYNGPSK